ncbi:MAG: DNA repair protein RecO [Rhizobiales bacterium]|nr:DNA repair protein RecO [Hyphomicrobiales bacterium]
MEWRDEGLVLATRRFGERDCVLEVMTEHHGRHLGLVRAGRSSRHAPMLQPGNRLALVWRARLDEHLGVFSAETLHARAGQVLASPLALHAVNHLGLLLRLMPEREAHSHVYHAADGLCGLLGEPAHLAATMVRFELMILSELGFGLDLSQCAATGSVGNLIYVSPKSARAVSAEAGAPYAGKLLKLPSFLLEAPRADVPPPELEALNEAFELAGFFLQRHVFEPRGISDISSRKALLTQMNLALAQG